MKIAQVAPLIESVPPQLYGGTERIVSYLTEALVEQGQEVTLFASGDSVTAADLVPCCDEGLRSDRHVDDAVPHHVTMLEQVRQRSDQFDIVHFHLDYLPLPFCRSWTTRTVNTLHSRLDLPDVAMLYREFDDVPLVSISESQREPFPDACWAGTIHHGLPLDLYPFSGSDEGYLAFLGRLSPEKRPDRAIKVAAAAGLPLKMAAKINDFELDYVDELKPLLKQPHVDFLGEIADDAKASFLGNARALLFPIDWPEPFGLAMIEAMACGTPVIAWHSGAAPEVVEHGVTGFIVRSMQDAIEAVRSVDRLDRALIRRRFEERFSAKRMAMDYIDVYRQLIGRPCLQAVPDRPLPAPAGTERCSA